MADRAVLPLRAPVAAGQGGGLYGIVAILQSSIFHIQRIMHSFELVYKASRGYFSNTIWLVMQFSKYLAPFYFAFFSPAKFSVLGVLSFTEMKKTL